MGEGVVVDLTIDDLRICPALAGPDEVAMLLKRHDELRRLLNDTLDIAWKAIGALETFQ